MATPDPRNMHRSPLGSGSWEDLLTGCGGRAADARFPFFHVSSKREFTNGPRIELLSSRAADAEYLS